jgi:hypothetical protein
VFELGVYEEEINMFISIKFAYFRIRLFFFGDLKTQTQSLQAFAQLIMLSNI